jgi:hypothetical protein
VDTSKDHGIAQQIAERRGDAILEMVFLGMEETLHLEFKTLSNETAFVKDDRRLIEKAICGLANAEGGILIVGVETTRLDGVDVATGSRPIKELARFQRLLTAALLEMLSPQHTGIAIDGVLEGPSSASGFLVVTVPTSDNRPHMGVKAKQYFRRGSDGTRTLDHSEVRELMLATREGRLQIDSQISHSSSTGDLRFGVSLFLILKNVGGVPVRAPYVRLRNSGGLWSIGTQTPHLSSNLISRSAGETDQGIYGTRDVLVHVEDEFAIARRETGLDFRLTGQTDIRSALGAIVRNGSFHSVSMMPFSDMQPLGVAAIDRPIQMAGFFGAENVPVKPFALEINKPALLRKFCEYHRELHEFVRAVSEA